VGGTPFIGPDLGTIAAPVKSTYTMAMGGPVAAGSPASCNAVAAGGSTSGYFATATPADASMRFFGTNTSGTVFFGNAALAMTDNSTAVGTPLQ
jgi:hypothetical protein